MAYIGKTPTPAALTASDITDGIISNSKLAQDIISAETELATAPADTDEFLISDAGTLKRIDASLVVGGGKINQVVSTTLSSTTTVASSNTSSFSDIPGLSVNITPTATSSKIFISFLINMAVGDGSKHIRVARDSTAINIGDAGQSNQIRSTITSRPTSANYGLDIAHMAGNFLDSPSTTSQVTYKIQGTLGATYNSTMYINRSDADANNDFQARTASTITVMEVLA